MCTVYVNYASINYQHTVSKVCCFKLASVPQLPMTQNSWTFKHFQFSSFLKCLNFCLMGLPFPGATPPWMVQDEEYSSGNQQIGPSYEEFLKESK